MLESRPPGHTHRDHDVHRCAPGDLPRHHGRFRAGRLAECSFKRLWAFALCDPCDPHDNGVHNTTQADREPLCNHFPSFVYFRCSAWSSN